MAASASVVGAAAHCVVGGAWCLRPAAITRRTLTVPRITGSSRCQYQNHWSQTGGICVHERTLLRGVSTCGACVSVLWPRRRAAALRGPAAGSLVAALARACVVVCCCAGCICALSCKHLGALLLPFDCLILLLIFRRYFVVAECPVSWSARRPPLTAGNISRLAARQHSNLTVLYAMFLCVSFLCADI